MTLGVTVSPPKLGWSRPARVYYCHQIPPRLCDNAINYKHVKYHNTRTRTTVRVVNKKGDHTIGLHILCFDKWAKKLKGKEKFKVWNPKGTQKLKAIMKCQKICVEH